MTSRLHLPSVEGMTESQRRIYDDILRTRGDVRGPFLAWLLSPGMADSAQQLGAFCRYGTTLELHESELLILYVAAHYKCLAEQQIHEPIAQKAGLGDEVLLAIRTDEVPPLKSPRMRLLAEVARSLVVHRTLSDDVFSRAAQVFGEKTMVEIVGIVGYYAFVAYTLNAFDMRAA